MPQVSKNILSKDTLNEIQSNFSWVLTQLSSEKMEFFLDAFLTRTERTMLAKRLIALFLLSKNFDSLDIMKILKISTNTIYYLKIKLETNPGAYEPVLKSLAKRESLIAFLRKIEKILEPLAAFAPPATKSEVLRRLRRL